MKRYQITEAELQFLDQMINFLNQDGNFMSDKGSKELKEILDRINSRPVIDMIVDTKAIDASLKQQQEEMTND